MQKLKWSQIVIALVYIALGVVFVIHPDWVESTLCNILAAAVALIGLLYLLGYFIMKTPDEGRRNPRGFIVGILLIAVAIFIMVRQDLVISIVPFLFGVMILIQGLLTVRAAFMIRKVGGDLWKVLIAGLVTIGLGLFIVLFPFETATLSFIFIGIGFIVSGIVSIGVEIIARSATKKREHELERMRDMEQSQPAEIVEVDPEDPEEEAEPVKRIATEDPEEKNETPESGEEPAPERRHQTEK